MARLAQLRNYLLPAGIGIGLAVVAGWFYLGWLPSQQRYLDARNFRLLTTLSDQIGGSIANFDKMMDNAADSGVEAGHVHEIVRSLEEVEVDKEDVEKFAAEYHDPPRIMVRADEGSHFLYFAYKRQVVTTAKQYVLRTDLDKLIRNLLPPADRNPFDAILVARSDGEVVFQTAAPGVSITQVGDFKSQAQPTKSKPVEPINVKSFSEFSSLTEVSVANTAYRLYTEPLPLPLPPFLSEQKSKDGAENGSTKSTWIVLGMVRSDQFRKECQAIPYRYFLWVSLLLVLAISAIPFLKVFASAPAERLRARDVTAIAVLGWVAATAVTFMLLDSYHWQKGIEKRDEIRMKGLAREIDGSLGAEQEAAFQQLDQLWTKPELKNALSAADKDKTRSIAGCESKGTCQKDILAEGRSKLEFYHHPQMLIWSDETGQQLVKWTVKGHITPFLKLDDPSITYYPAVKRAFADPMATGPNPVYKQGIGAIYSPNTGENLTIFWKIETSEKGGTEGGKGGTKKYCASLATIPVSVICPILPADFQFAIIRADGTVVYHSDRTRNLRENFFAEVDEDQEVRSRVAMKSEGALLTKYMGKSYRVYVHPMSTNAQESWTIVLLRDMQGEETMNLEVLSLATILFALYALALALALAWAHWSQRAQRTRNWLWPDSRRAGTYRKLVAVNAVVILGLMVLSEFRINWAVLLLIVCIPLATMVYNFVALKRSPGSATSKDEEKGEAAFSWTNGYVATFATLLAVVAIVPCLGFFKAAWEFEQKLMIERNQLQLTEDISTRRQFVRFNYENVKGYDTIASEMEEPRLAEPGPAESKNQPTFFYKDEILKTEICRDAGEQGRSMEECGKGQFEEADTYEERFLGSISPRFNQIASEGRSLIQAATKNPKNPHWLLRRSPDGENQEHLEFASNNGGGKATAVSSVWRPLRMPPGDWMWWLGASVFGLLVYAAVSSTLEKVFQLRMKGRETEETSDPPIKPEDLARNLLVVGPSSSFAIANLERRNDVQVRDLYQMVRAPMHKATAVGWSWSGIRAPKEPLEEVVRQLAEDGRAVVFRNFDRGPEQKMLPALETILARFHGAIIITSAVDPVSKAKEENRARWEAALQTFVRRDLSSHPSWHVPESCAKIADTIAEEAYYDWLLSGRTNEQKLLLAQVAEEKLVNPNTKSVAEELVNEGLLTRSHGMLEVFSGGFAKFLKYAIPRKEIQAWEKEGAGSQRASLRMSLLMAGAVVVLFLLYTQGALVQTWTQYLGAVGAAIAAVFKLINVIRQGGTTGTEAS